MTETMSVKEVADLLQCTEETVMEKAAAGQLAAVKFGRSWVFMRAALLEGLHQTALANIRAGRASAPKAPAPETLAYAVTVPPSRRQAANRSRRPELPPQSVVGS